MGSNVNFSGRPEPVLAAQALTLNSLLRSTPEPESSGDFSRFAGPSNRPAVWSGTPKYDAGLRFSPGSYSAAARMAFESAADSMKSLIRGTISDLKREPLNTP
jgi:hypothetical protein